MGRGNLGDLSVDGRWNNYFEMNMQEIVYDSTDKIFSWFSIGFIGASCEHGNEIHCFTISVKFSYQLSDYQFLKKDSAPWYRLMHRFISQESTSCRRSLANPVLSIVYGS
jgi:hypothetical protein